MQNLLFSTGMTLTAYIDFLNSSKDEAYLYALLSLIRLSKAIQSQSYQSKKKKRKSSTVLLFFSSFLYCLSSLFLFMSTRPITQFSCMSIVIRNLDSFSIK